MEVTDGFPNFVDRCVDINRVVAMSINFSLHMGAHTFSLVRFLGISSKAGIGNSSRSSLVTSEKYTVILRGLLKNSIRQFPLVIIKTTESLGSYGTTESLGVHT